MPPGYKKMSKYGSFPEELTAIYMYIPDIDIIQCMYTSFSSLIIKNINIVTAAVWFIFQHFYMYICAYAEVDF